jgi:hypothetical protein
MSRNVWQNLLAFALITLLSLIIAWVLRIAGFAPRSDLITTLTAVVIVLIAALVYRSTMIRVSGESFLWLAVRTLRPSIGLIRVYKNYDLARGAIERDFEKADQAQIFMQLGHGIIGGNRSLLFERARCKVKRNFRMMLLYGDKESPFLSEGRSAERGSNYKEWISAMRVTESSIDALRHENLRIEARKHREAYLWRLFILGDVVYVLPYIFERGNSQRAPVLCFKKDSGGGSVYEIFVRYFESVWETGTPYE